MVITRYAKKKMLLMRAVEARAARGAAVKCRILACVQRVVLLR